MSQVPLSTPPPEHQEWGQRGARNGQPGLNSSFFLNSDASVFSRDLSNNKISSLSNSSFTNMSQLTTL